MTSSSNSFVIKPARGWIHSDQLIEQGITYAVRYIGCLAVNTSMKLLDFDTRSLVAKECINRICEAAGLKTADKKRKVDKRVAKAIGDRPVMDNAGSNVNLTISSSHLILTSLDTNKVLATHSMPHISFASCGDADTLDFMAYVAKDAPEIRACYVLECGGGLVQEVMTTIGQAFELRYKEYITKPLGLNACEPDDRDYYNDLPGKVPPDIGPPPVPPLPNLHQDRMACAVGAVPQDFCRFDLGATNLIDLNSEVPAPRPEHDYVNDIASKDRGQPRDIFDMPDHRNILHLGTHLRFQISPVNGEAVGKANSMPVPFSEPFSAAVESATARIAVQRSLLQGEVWFHGFVGRQEAEAMVTQDGDFLVRESQGSAGQFVLTGFQGGVKKHLLLIDPEGVVRTKDRMFESVSHLINYHCENQLPIISAESALVLRRPVPRSSLSSVR